MPMLSFCLAPHILPLSSFCTSSGISFLKFLSARFVSGKFFVLIWKKKGFSLYHKEAPALNILNILPYILNILPYSGFFFLSVASLIAVPLWTVPFFFHLSDLFLFYILLFHCTWIPRCHFLFNFSGPQCFLSQEFMSLVNSAKFWHYLLRRRFSVSSSRTSQSIYLRFFRIYFYVSPSG